jgi:hypothetical protein
MASVDTSVHETGDKGLRSGALGFISSVVIGVASTAPGYSPAASLGLVTIVVGLQAPAIMLLAFVPMLFIASSYYYLNRADPDCGTTFAWVLTGFACPIYYRHHLTTSIKNFLFIGVSPIIGALILSWAFYRSATDLYSTSDNGTWFGVGQAFIIGIGFLAVGWC